jgi:ATP-dependent helicase/DNAse subunit B
LRETPTSASIGAALWLAPNHRAAEDIADRLLDVGSLDGSLQGCLSPNLLTFDHLARRVLALAAPRLRPISPATVRFTLERLVKQAAAAGRLEYFAPIAQTPGFLDLLVGFIRELKRLEIWPEELAAAQGNRATSKDRELCSLYRDYQELLNRHDLFDTQGQAWAARELLRAGKWGPLVAVRHIFVDGFTDFTRTEHEMLDLLSRRAESLTISLPGEQDGQRPELFEKVRLTVAQLQSRYPNLQFEHLARRTGAPPALTHLERGLFGNPRAAQPVADGTGLEIVAAAGVTHEIELIAERIKKLLSHGDASGNVAPAEILVVFRSLGELAPLVREIFTRFGIPAVVSSPRSLESAPLLAALVHWLRLDQEDWPFREVLAAIGHNYFQPAWPEWKQGRAARDLESLVRQLELPAGRQELLGAVEWLEARGATELAEKQRASHKALAALHAAPFLRRIVATFGNLPRTATALQWSAALRDFAAELGMFRAVDAQPLGETAAIADRLAWERLTLALADCDRFARWIGEPAPLLSRAEFLDLLQDVLRAEQQPLAADDAGRVRVIAAESARGLSAPYVFLAGLSERAFPPPNRDDCLYTDADARRWGAHGLPLPSHELRGRFEMLLFYECVTRATRQLVLSYPALDAAAQPMVPSPYLSEVEHACGAGRIPRNAQPHLQSVPASDAVYSVRDFRVRAVSQALVKENSLLAELCAHPVTHQAARNILAGLRMSEARRGQQYGAFDGMFTSTAAKARLAERFGKDRCWSPSQLEQYAYCPQRFLLANVLRITPTGEPELGIDFMERGKMLHWLLSTAHRELNAAAGGHTSPGRSLERFNELVRKLADELRQRGTSGSLESGLQEIDVRKISEWLARYLRQHREYDQQWSGWDKPPQPAHFEVAFGPRHGEEDSGEAPALPDDCDPLSTIDPFELVCAGETIRFAGRIDRIDLGSFGGQAVFTIVDYKSGVGSKRTSLQAVLDGRSLQLPLYALAAEHLLSSLAAAPFRAAYWHIAGKGYQEKDAVKFRVAVDSQLEANPEWTALESAIKTRVGSLVAGIRGGQFPMHSADDECTGFCEFSTVCRVNQARALEKTWQPPGEPQP